MLPKTTDGDYFLGLQTNTHRQKNRGTYMEKLVYSFAETANLLDISRGTLYKLMEEGQIKGFQIGRVWKFPCKEIERYIDSQMKDQ